MGTIVTTAIQNVEAYLGSFTEFSQRCSGHDVPWLRSRRENAFARFCETGFPTSHDEDWRFTSVSAIARTAFSFGQPLAQELPIRCGMDPPSSLDRRDRKAGCPELPDRVLAQERESCQATVLRRRSREIQLTAPQPGVCVLSVSHTCSPSAGNLVSAGSPGEREPSSVEKFNEGSQISTRK